MFSALVPKVFYIQDGEWRLPLVDYRKTALLILAAMRCVVLHKKTAYGHVKVKNVIFV